MSLLVTRNKFSTDPPFFELSKKKKICISSMKRVGLIPIDSSCAGSSFTDSINHDLKMHKKKNPEKF